VIASVSTQEGETVAAGFNAPTFVTIIDLGRLQVDTFVDEVDIGKVEVGQEATFTVDTFTDREFKGRVNAIYPKAVIQENVVNYDVVVTIASDYENLLRPEMTTNVTILLETQSDALVIPSGALQRERGRNILYLQTPDGPKAREVKVGRREGQWVQILEGLSEGQTVFLKPPASAGQSESDL
jgi:macrolide-specific efflux system membrane fusion protein